MHVLVPCGWLLYAPVHKWHRQGSSWLTERASCCQRTCTGSQQSSLGVNNTLRGLTFLNCDTLWLLVTGLFRDQISFDLNFYASVSRKRDIWNLTHPSTLQNTNNFCYDQLTSFYKETRPKNLTMPMKRSSWTKLMSRPERRKEMKRRTWTTYKFGKYLD